MPNWVYNNITITGNLEDLSILKRTLAMPAPIQFCAGQLEFHGFNFHSLISPAPELWDEYNTTDYWYRWNVDNWGCKWDADEQSSHDNLNQELSSYTLTYSLNTPWSPPDGIMNALASKLAELNLASVQCLWEYQEEQGWGGSVSINMHGATTIDEYDIPNSHSEQEARFGECCCSEVGEKIYDDCPSFEEDDDSIKSGDGASNGVLMG